MKVLFCTDGSQSANFAIEKALDLLKTNIEVHIINSIDWGVFPTFVTFPYEAEVGFPNEKSLSEEILNEAETLIKKLGPKSIKKDFMFGPADKVILDLIEEECYDLVVMGSHGKKGISKWLGSVSRKVINKSPVPVLIARPPQEEKDKVENKEVLVAADGSACSLNAVKRMTELFNLESTNIEIINIIPGIESLPVEISMDSEWLKTCIQRQETLAEEIFGKVENILNEKGLKVKNKIIKRGDAALEILEYVNENPKWLTVLGSHGREGFSRFILGSVSKRVLDNINNLILIIPLRK
jgi:nucleotide-binding universal stress UspA family protein